MAVHLQADGQVVAVNGEYVPHIAVDVLPDLSFDQALDIAHNDLGDETAELLTDYSQLTIYTDTPTPTLTWQVTLISQAIPGNWIYFIDAQSGAVVYRLNQVGLAKTHPTNNSDDISTSAGKSIATYDANYTQTLPATPTCTNSNGTCPGGDADERAAHRHISIVYDYFKETFGLDSYADVFAVLVDYYHNPNTANWLMFEDVWTPGIAGDALRDLSDPSEGAGGQFNSNKPFQSPNGQPDHMSLYVDISNHGWPVDSGAVHVNSGILNKAAYLIAEGGTYYGIEVAGIGRDQLAQIYFRALTEYLTPTSDFKELRNAARRACADLFGSGHTYCASVQNGFAAVGLGVPASFS